MYLRAPRFHFRIPRSTSQIHDPFPRFQDHFHKCSQFGFDNSAVDLDLVVVKLEIMMRDRDTIKNIMYETKFEGHRARIYLQKHVCKVGGCGHIAEESVFVRSAVVGGRGRMFPKLVLKIAGSRLERGGFGNTCFEVRTPFMWLPPSCQHVSLKLGSSPCVSDVVW